MTTKASGARLVPFLGGALLLLLAALVGLTVTGYFSAPATVGAPGTTTTLLQAQSGITRVRQALTGDADALADLPGMADSLRTKSSGLPAAQARALGQLTDLMTRLGGSQDVLQGLRRSANDLDLLAAELADRAYSLEAALTLQDGAVVAAQLERLRLLGEFIRRETRGLTQGLDADAASQPLLDAEMGLTQIVRGFQSGDPELGLRAVNEPGANEALTALAGTVAAMTEKLRDVIAESDQLVALSRSRTQLDSLAATLAEPVGAAGVTTLPVGDLTADSYNVLVGIGAASLAIFLLITVIYFRTAGMRRAAQLQAEQTERNQQAIMRLLDEIASLADGDLTVNATVTEDMTGAIADSINYAIDALRELVTTVNDSAIMVDGAARQTDVTAQQLAAASANQSKQIEAASQAIARMAASIEEVSGNAERSSDVARHSVDVAHKGGDAVRRTIAGMNTIRETIQDTSKRIKRLGESSQEIGNIVELINDIAEQTNILALNASIQASMAGEAGRGFSVVADEVQRLAERSANATKQIEVLVRTIQADTNEAVVSMERSTTDVVGGALLAENAGAALDEIEQVSNQIASLVQNISDSSREQGKAATAVNVNMDALQKINSETASSTSETTGAIRKLAELASQLRESVSGFMLPETESRDDEPPPVAEPEEDIVEPPPHEQTATERPMEFADQRTA
ncbi:MAG: methyl-accepting chemotaxis protein [Gammaproteobacteria bacterium]|nr:methyl-accepting chemotaxis protein [Gammaproteobacteria bacterium]